MSRKTSHDGWTSVPIYTPSSSLFTTLKHEAPKKECRNFHIGKFDRDGGKRISGQARLTRKRPHLEPLERPDKEPKPNTREAKKWNMQKRRYKRQQERLAKTKDKWVIDDPGGKQGKVKYEGLPEANRAPTHVLLELRDGAETHFIAHAVDGFRFRKHAAHKILDIDEAEAVMKDRNKKAERWMMKKHFGVGATSTKDETPSLLLGGEDAIDKDRVRQRARSGGRREKEQGGLDFEFVGDDDDPEDLEFLRDQDQKAGDDQSDEEYGTTGAKAKGRRKFDKNASGSKVAKLLQKGDSSSDEDGVGGGLWRRFKDEAGGDEALTGETKKAAANGGGGGGVDEDDDDDELNDDDFELSDVSSDDSDDEDDGAGTSSQSKAGSQAMDVDEGDEEDDDEEETDDKAVGKQDVRKTFLNCASGRLTLKELIQKLKAKLVTQAARNKLIQYVKLLCDMIKDPTTGEQFLCLKEIRNKDEKRAEAREKREKAREIRRQEKARKLLQSKQQGGA